MVKCLKVIDSHAHLSMDTFKQDLQSVIEHARSRGVVAVMNPTIDKKDFLEALQIQKKYPDFIYVALGLAPQLLNERKLDEFMEAINEYNNKYLAIGECGLDYYWVTKPKEIEFMRQAFMKVMEVVAERKKPIIIHARSAHRRNAYREIIKYLKEFGIEKAVFHAFLGKKSDALEIIKGGWMLGIPTIYMRRRDLWGVIKAVPLDNMVIETDSPYLSPVKGTRNEPANVVGLIDLIAEIKGKNKEEIACKIYENTKALFNI